MEAKQSRQGPGEKYVAAAPGPQAPRGRRGAARGWDVLMVNARAQAENYVRLLPEGHEPPPFVIVCDVGHCFEIYANFRRDGKAFDQDDNALIVLSQDERIEIPHASKIEVARRLVALIAARMRPA